LVTKPWVQKSQTLKGWFVAPGSIHAAPRQRRSRRVVEVSSADFTIAVVGKTIDGVLIREELFVSKSG
jgi:hypothetical protein